MPKVARLILAMLMFMLAAFCLFGFLATFEPGSRSIAWRILYGIVGPASSVAAVNLVRSAWSQRAE